MKLKGRRFWRRFRKASDEHEREERAQRRRELEQRVRELLRKGDYGAEGEYLQVVKDIRQDMGLNTSIVEAQEIIRQFRSAVSERRLLDQE